LITNQTPSTKVKVLESAGVADTVATMGGFAGS